MEKNVYVCVKDFETLACKKLTKGSLGFYQSGATAEQTLHDNVAAFKRWRFQPRVLRNVSNVDMSMRVLGGKIEFPVCVAPVGIGKLASAGGEMDMAQAAESVGTCFAMSMWATVGIEEVAAQASSVLRYFQIYLFKDRELVRSLVKRAEANGFSAIIVTVDTPVRGIRYTNLRNHFQPPSHLRYNFDPSQFEAELKYSGSVAKDAVMDSSLTWSDIKWIRTITHLPIIVKGILTADMALEAVRHRADGVIVSNHGGRQLDGVLAAVDALPQIVKAVGGRCPVYLDGGVRNGGDVAKAIALGASAVFVGRPMLWGIACDGKHGGQKVLEILRDEFELTMKLLGVRTIEELQSIAGLVIHETDFFSKL